MSDVYEILSLILMSGCDVIVLRYIEVTEKIQKKMTERGKKIPRYPLTVFSQSLSSSPPSFDFSPSPTVTYVHIFFGAPDRAVEIKVQSTCPCPAKRNLETSRSSCWRCTRDRILDSGGR